MNVTGGCLVVAYQESPNDQAALEFQRTVFETSIRRQTDGIIFDVSGVHLMDSLMSKGLIATCRAGDILGKKTVVVGLKPAVIASLVDLEIDLSGVLTAVNIEEAINLIHPAMTEAEFCQTDDTVPDEDIQLKESDDDDNEDEDGEEEGFSE